MATAADHELEQATLHFVNLIAYSAHNRTYRRRFNVITGLDLPGADIGTLNALTDDPLTTGVLAERLRIDITQASRQVARLAALGLVEKHRDATDRRRIYVSLTADGRSRLDAWRAVWVNDYLLPVEGWSDDEVDALGAWFTIVYDALAPALEHVSERALPPDWHRPGTTPDRRRESFLATTVRLAHLVANSHGFEDLLASSRVDLSEMSYLTLRDIWRHGPTTVSDIATRLTIDTSQASKRVTALRERHLLDEAVDTLDRRSIRLRASRRGAALVRRIHTAQLMGFVLLLDELDPEQRRRWTDLAQRYVRVLATATVDKDGWLVNRPGGDRVAG